MFDQFDSRDLDSEPRHRQPDEGKPGYWRPGHEQPGHRLIRRIVLIASLSACLVAGWAAGGGMLAAAETVAAARGQLELHVFDKDSGQAVAVRMHLKNARGRAIHPPRVPFWKDHFVFDGKIVLELPPGAYTFELERGPEYRLGMGEFTIRSGATDRKEVAMERFVDMKSEGWWSGDLHVHRSPEDLPLLMQAEDLHVAPVITWWNDQNPWKDQPLPEDPLRDAGGNRWYHLLGGEDERGGGALLYLNLKEPLPIGSAEREYPSSVHFLRMAREKAGGHIDIEKPFWWDMPIWVGTGRVDSIGIAHNHMWREGVLDNEAWGKPRDTTRYPAPWGNGMWTQDIYYHLLNCGLRIPPSAGSASGVLPNPVGYNRVYVHCGEDFSYERWFDNLRAGRVLVTNGPMMRATVNGQLPGSVFYGEPGDKIELKVALKLSLREKVDYLEFVQDGRVVQSFRLEDYKEKRGKLPPVVFEQSGWMMVRAVTQRADTYRFAATGPFYVEIGGKVRVQRESAQFFVDWVYERARQLPLEDPQQKNEVIQDFRQARDFWQQRLEMAE